MDCVARTTIKITCSELALVAVLRVGFGLVALKLSGQMDVY